MSDQAGESDVEEIVEESEGGRLGAVLRLAALVAVVAAVTLVVQQSGWSGPTQLREAVEDAGAWGWALFVVGYALLVLIPTPASVLTIAAGALFGMPGFLAAWAGAVLGACGGFFVGRLVGRSAVDRLLGGRLRQADEVLSQHGLAAVLAVRMLPIFPFTPLNYASGLLAVRFRDYVLGTAVGILPGAVAYTAVGAAGADPLGIALALALLVLLLVAGGWWGRRMLRASREPQR